MDAWAARSATASWASDSSGSSVASGWGATCPASAIAEAVRLTGTSSSGSAPVMGTSESERRAGRAAGAGSPKGAVTGASAEAMGLPETACLCLLAPVACIAAVKALGALATLASRWRRVMDEPKAELAGASAGMGSAVSSAPSCAREATKVSSAASSESALRAGAAGAVAGAGARAAVPSAEEFQLGSLSENSPTTRYCRLSCC